MVSIRPMAMLVCTIAIVISSVAKANHPAKMKTQGILPPVLTEPPIDTRGSFLNPRVPRSEGPWFDGWYYRISDKNSDKSVAIIATSYLDPKEKYSTSRPMKGYLAVLVSHGANTPLQVYEYFPQQTWLLVNNKVVSSDTQYGEQPNFTWVAEKFGKVSAEEVELTLPDFTIKATFKGRIPWNNKYSDWGPGGLSTYIGPVPLKWFVYSLGSKATFEVQNAAGEVTLQGEGFAHQEKNWGATFPKKWIWMQGIHTNNQAQVALAGGTVHIAGLGIDKWVLAYKAPGVDLEFQSDQMNVEFLKKIDPANGRFELIFADLKHTLILKAHSVPSQFGMVSIPTVRGYKKNGAKESFSTTIDVEVYKNVFPFTVRSRQLIDKRTFTNAALEFGDEYMIKQ